MELTFIFFYPSVSYKFQFKIFLISKSGKSQRMKNKIYHKHMFKYKVKANNSRTLRLQNYKKQILRKFST